MAVKPANTEQVVVSSQAFEFTATHLKPLTLHNFYFGDVNHNADCKPRGKVKGADIITDASGNVRFTYYYNSGLPTTATDYTAYNNLLNNATGSKVAKLASADNASVARFSIRINNANTVNYYHTTQT
jgi:hypothetical protein